MDVALGLGVALLLAGGPGNGAARTPPGSGELRPLVLNVSPFAESCVRRAVDLAVGKLQQPGCADVYNDFQLPNGETPQTVLDEMGIGPAQLLERLVFFDGSTDRVCLQGRAVLTTTPGSHVIYVCPGFPLLHLQNPELSASLIIHESLHVLGLAENPPSSSAITQRVERRCWKGGR
jgi:hypothetical protein